MGWGGTLVQNRSEGNEKQAHQASALSLPFIHKSISRQLEECRSHFMNEGGRGRGGEDERVVVGTEFQLAGVCVPQ